MVSASEAISLAKRRCKSWGYSGAEAFGGTTRSCSQFGGMNGCRIWLVSKEYQCSGDGQGATMVPTPARRSASAAKQDKEVVGKYQYNAEKLAKSHACEQPTLLTQNPPVEMYQTMCSGNHYVIKCEWGSCAVVK